MPDVSREDVVLEAMLAGVAAETGDRFFERLASRMKALGIARPSTG